MVVVVDIGMKQERQRRGLRWKMGEKDIKYDLPVFNILTHPPLAHLVHDIPRDIIQRIGHDLEAG